MSRGVVQVSTTSIVDGRTTKERKECWSKAFDATRRPEPCEQNRQHLLRITVAQAYLSQISITVHRLCLYSLTSMVGQLPHHPLHLNPTHHFLLHLRCIASHLPFMLLCPVHVKSNILMVAHTSLSGTFTILVSVFTADHPDDSH